MLVTKVGTSKGPRRYIEFLIDSGADYTLLSKSSAFLIGLDYDKMPSTEIDIELANSTYIKAKRTQLNIEIEGRELVIPVLIANQAMENLLGRRGVFDRYEICFREWKKQVSFKAI